MRIAIVTESWLPSTDGVVTRLSATVRQLRQSGHEVLIVAPRGADSDFVGAQVRGVPTLSVPFIYGGKPWGLPLPRAHRYIKEFGADVVHVVNPMLLGMAGVWSARRQQLPLVASYHTDVARYAGFYHLAWLRPLIWWVVRLLHGRATVNLATSESAAAQLTDRGIPRVQLWRRGVDLDLFDPARRNGSADAARAAGRMRALYVGRIAGEKGLDRLAPLVTLGGDTDLVLVGDGPGRAELARRFAGAPVQFAGTLHGTELAAAYADADVFVFPSTTETLGLVLLEALASGVPVLAADTPASREIAGACPAFRLFPPDRPDLVPGLVKELLDVAPRQELATLARAEAQRWGWRAATEQLLGYYESARATGAVPTPPHRRLQQIAVFASVGLSNAIVDLGVFNLILLVAPSRAPVRLAAYNTIAVVAAIVNSYVWNSRLTFRGRTAQRGGALWRQRLLYAVQGVINILLNDVIVGFASGILDTTDLSTPVANNLAKVFAMGSSSFLSFLIMHFLVFRTADGAAP